MSTYASVNDFLSYTTVSVNTGSGALQTLLDNAELDLDSVLGRGNVSNAVQGFQMSNVTGGTWNVSLNWLGIEYTSPDIPYDVDGADLTGIYLNELADQYGNLIPSKGWDQPTSAYYAQKWAYGPLPDVPITVEAVGSLAEQRLPVMTADKTGLTGTNPSVTVTQIVGGGLTYNPYWLNARDSYALNRALCAQAEYRDQMGEEFFIKAQWRSVSGPEFNTQGSLPMIGPKVRRELAGTDLIQRGARAVISPANRRAQAYFPSGGTPIPDDWRAI